MASVIYFCKNIFIYLSFLNNFFIFYYFYILLFTVLHFYFYYLHKYLPSDSLHLKFAEL